MSHWADCAGCGEEIDNWEYHVCLFGEYFCRVCTKEMTFWIRNKKEK